MQTVDRGRINMTNKQTVTQYFDTLKRTLIKTGIAEVDDNNEIIHQHSERIYLADETGWGAEKKSKRVVGRKGASHAYVDADCMWKWRCVETTDNPPKIISYARRSRSITFKCTFQQNRKWFNGKSLVCRLVEAFCSSSLVKHESRWSIFVNHRNPWFKI